MKILDKVASALIIVALFGWLYNQGDVVRAEEPAAVERLIPPNFPTDATMSRVASSQEAQAKALARWADVADGLPDKSSKAVNDTFDHCAPWTGLAGALAALALFAIRVLGPFATAWLQSKVDAAKKAPEQTKEGK